MRFEDASKVRVMMPGRRENEVKRELIDVPIAGSMKQRTERT